MKRKKNDAGGFVYSTNPDFIPASNDEENTFSWNKNDIQLRIHLDRLGGGKLVSRINGFPPDYNELTELSKELKQKCGVGGSVKNNEILIQGDHREKIMLILLKHGFKAKKAGG